MTTVFGVILIVLCVAIIGLVVCQDAKSEGINGVLSGGAENSFYGRQKNKQLQSILNKATIVCSILMAIVVILMLALAF